MHRVSLSTAFWYAKENSTNTTFMLVPGKIVLDHAFANGYAVGAFNANNMEQVQAIVRAAHETQSPVFIQVARGTLDYTPIIYIRNLIQAAAEEFPEVPVVMHLDHGSSFEIAKKAIDMGFTSVMIDGSLDETGKIPNTYEQNLAVTQQVLEYARPRGVTVEAELGTLGGYEDGAGAGDSGQFTDPQQAVDFINAAPVDSLAIAIGTSHGAHKFTGESKLAFDVLKEIHDRLPQQKLVMHGSSSLPQELIDQVNAYGGKLENAKGVALDQLQETLKYGVTKINVDTDGRITMTGSIRKTFAEKPEEFDPRKYLGPARDALQAMVAQRMRDFGCAGHAGAIQQITLEQAKALY